MIPILRDHEERLRDLFKSLESAQLQHVNNKGKYAQLPPSCSVIPTSGLDAIQDKRQAAIVNSTKWSDFGMGMTFPFSVECHEWVSSSAMGFRMIAKVQHMGRTYRKIVGETGWEDITE